MEGPSISYRWLRPLIGGLALSLTIALVLFSLRTTTLVVAQKQEDGEAVQTPQATQAIFPANVGTLGAIPDGTGGPGVPGAPLNVTFTASGLTANVATVSVDFNAAHSWVGDLEVTLQAPGGAPSLVLFDRTGATAAASFGSSNDLASGSNMLFADSSSVNWWTRALAGTPIAAGNSRTVLAGPIANPPAVTSLNTTFAGLTPAQANGTWTLRFRDGGAGDTGSVTAANLTITTAVPVCTLRAPVDFDGDNKTDQVTIRNTGGGPTGQVTWFINNAAGFRANPWGIATDFFMPADFDGDGKTDIAVWRPGAPTVASFYILQSLTNTFRQDVFGQTGDDPTVVGDYDGDGKADPAVYRAGATAGAQSFWYYRQSAAGVNQGNIIFNPWGVNGDFPSPGDYDGDGKYDFTVQRNNGGGQAIFHTRGSLGVVSSVIFGTPTDVIVPGDYDGDCKTDYATVRGSLGNIQWWVRKSSDLSVNLTTFGASATDFTTQGDYDGDGKTDVGVWRPNVDPTQNFFFYIFSGTNAPAQAEWGANGDYPVANFNSH